MSSGAGSAQERQSLPGKHAGQRLRPRDRLRKRFEFRRVRDLGRRVHTQSFLLQVARGQLVADGEPGARIGLTVSRKVGNAVRRNRVKRLLREAFRQHRELLPRGADVVVIARSDCRVDSLGEVVAELSQAGSALRAVWNKLGSSKVASERKGTRR